MGESNAHYYATRDPLGSGGDFTTAPEISQMFGELVGLWLADIWSRAGAPPDPLYCELGPGRGTLAGDGLRSMARFGLAPQVHFIEGSPTLRSLQAQAVPGAQFHEDLTSVPEDRPLLLVANEFFDALPVRQLVRIEDGWRERMVGLGDDGAFRFVAGDQPMHSAVPPELVDADTGTIVETCPAASAIMHEIARRLVTQGGVALIIDYGHLGRRTGSTLQAIRAHRKVDPLAEPGAADLTAHVDFPALADVARHEGARVLGSATQNEWLTALGIDARAGALAKAAPHRAEEVEAARSRLVAPEQMGALFKVIAFADEAWPDGSGLN
ncbi:class I SAM-dependent methyltransferase [Alteriqipengyuania lutimaris]|uniref:Class I SAM-dependent methyltransferase n=1 Tax=Alteriqipengyuania lutimaris TaxID=1538146 RepID=A0A395LJT6_9SPHN|nr:SAM-dependent methyltransferase [Alteriqipengyuania lutimaris]MBB3034130.1 NADH dehydrogenase [ubiquinone] 1 alpha subcomplex assembly factor 7 [Alteriqipengyuania lutimaris]RDS76939.1 class I SAM-dependent methyltransferase [Alteriqipengyuania lutimaris]